MGGHLPEKNLPPGVETQDLPGIYAPDECPECGAEVGDFVYCPECDAVLDEVEAAYERADYDHDLARDMELGA